MPGHVFRPLLGVIYRSVPAPSENMFYVRRLSNLSHCIFSKIFIVLYPVFLSFLLRGVGTLGGSALFCGWSSGRGGEGGACATRSMDAV